MKTKNASAWLGLILLFFGASMRVQATSWSFTGSMKYGRQAATATLLTNGEVLIVGGHDKDSLARFCERVRGN